MFEGSVVKTWSSTQASVAQSSGEAEYCALVKAACEALGAQSLLRDMGKVATITIWIDSSAAKGIASRAGLAKMGHMEVKFLWAQESLRKKRFVIRKIGGKDDCAAGTHCACEGRRRHLLFSSFGQKCRCHLD